ncbi:WbqC family protein [Polaromonas sp.]|uniref:WbqC family protein n=1 Tax=Polaromonas sp. TaxID=1869339 RepID=UPI003262E64E
MMRVAIMQPTYLPWCGYFGLMQAVDVFVLLDSVQFARRSWQQRNQIKAANGVQWLSVPVLSKGKRDQLISEVEVDRTGNFALAHRKTIEMSYAKTPFFKAYADDLLPLLDNPSPRLSDLTISLILWLKSQLGITTQVLRSSELGGSGAKGELLASLCRELGASSYISPPGSKDYLDETDAFEKIGVPVKYYEFKHPVYPQPFGDFMPYMSTIDMLFNCGERSLSLIESGIEVKP